MKYIFRCEPSDFTLAGRAIKAALKSEFTTRTAIKFNTGQVFFVRRNKSSISVTSGEYHGTSI